MAVSLHLYEPVHMHAASRGNTLPLLYPSRGSSPQPYQLWRESEREVVQEGQIEGEQELVKGGTASRLHRITSEFSSFTAAPAEVA